jgi:hypothetical protein
MTMRVRRHRQQWICNKEENRSGGGAFRTMGTILRTRGEKIGASWITLVAAMAGSAWFSTRLGQDINWDLFNYHLYNGYALLHKPLGYDFAPAQVQSFFNPLFHVISYSLVANLPGKVVAIILGAIQGLNIYLVFQISQHLLCGRMPARLRTAVSLANALAGFYGAVNIIELGTTFADNITSIPVLLAILLIVRYLAAGRLGIAQKPVYLWIVGSLLGVALALKLTAVTFVAAIGLILAVALPLAGARFRLLALLYAGMAIGFVAGYGYWGIHLYRQYRNPMFPYLNNIFHSPYFSPKTAMDVRYMPRDWRQKLFYPFFFAVKNNWMGMTFRDIRLALCYLAILFIAGYFALKWIRRPRAPGMVTIADAVPLLFLASFFVLSYIAWQRLFSIYRYLSVLEFLAPTLLALSAATFLRRPLRVVALSLLINVGICATTVIPGYGRLKPFDDHLLDVNVPAIPELDKSLVLMAGDEATAYIAAQFPATTRFARVYANFYRPAVNLELDGVVRAILSKYDDSRMLAYISGPEKIRLMRSVLRYFGLQLIEGKRWDLGGRRRSHGFLYSVASTPEPPKEESILQETVVPSINSASAAVSNAAFLKSNSVGLQAQPSEAVAGKDTIVWQVSGLETVAIDLMYTLDGKEMPPVRFWELDEDLKVEAVTTEITPRGLYHVTAIRDSFDPRANAWYPVDVRLLLH